MADKNSNTNFNFVPKSALSAWQEVERLAHELLARPATKVPPASLVLTALGRGALVIEHTDDPEYRNHVDGKPLPPNIKFKSASVLSKKLADDIERDAELRKCEPYRNSYQTLYGDGCKETTNPPVDMIPRSIPLTEPRLPQATQASPASALFIIPTTTIAGKEMAFKKNHEMIHIADMFSDGNAKLTIPNGYIVDVSAQRARKVLATKWMESRGLAQPDTLYILDALPSHYVVASNQRKPQDRHNYVFGLPNGQRFDSAAQFYPHFEHMVLHGTTNGCECKHCSAQ